MTTMTETAETPEQAPRTSRRQWWALLAFVVVFATLGYAAGVVTPFLRAPDDTSAEAGFARDMSRHHAQAVEMAMIAYAKGTSPDVRQIGYDMALTQQAQIGHMQRWLQEWNLLPTGSRPAMAWMPEGMAVGSDGLMPGMATREEIVRLHEAEGVEVDRLFIQMIIKHHLGGIHMADGVLDVTDRKEVVDMAQAMKAAQQKEINELRAVEQTLT